MLSTLQIINIPVRDDEITELYDNNKYWKTYEETYLHYQKKRNYYLDNIKFNDTNINIENIGTYIEKIKNFRFNIYNIND